MKPLRDLIVITLDPREETNESGLFITKTWDEAISTATVDAIGPDVTSVDVGDHIELNPYAVIKGKYVREKDVLARG